MLYNMEVQISLLNPKVDYFGWNISWEPSIIPAKFWGNTIKETKKCFFTFVHNIIHNCFFITQKWTNKLMYQREISYQYTLRGIQYPLEIYNYWVRLETSKGNYGKSLAVQVQCKGFCPNCRFISMSCLSFSLLCVTSMVNVWSEAV